jgi:glycosyltransferase involved in cell wall biosynthesis
MPVLFVSGKHPIHEANGGQGHSIYVRVHARAAARAGYTPYLFCVDRRDEEESTDFGHIIQRRSIPPYRQLGIVAHAPVLIRAIERFVIERNIRSPLVIHAFGVWSYVGAIAAERLRKRGVPVTAIASSYTTIRDEVQSLVDSLNPSVTARQRIALLAELAWVKAVVWRYEAAGYTRSALVTVNYRAVRTAIERTYGSRVRMRNAPYTSESAFIWERGDAGAKDRAIPTFVSVSVHSPRKGIDVFLRALALLRDRGIDFRATLVGGGSLLDNHRRLATQLNLDRHVLLTGNVSDVMPYYVRADAYVLPSLAEQSGSLALIESMQAGLPSIVSSCDGLPEDVRDGETGLLVAPGDVKALARALARVAGDPALRAQMGAAARALFDEKFSADAMAADLDAIYLMSMRPHSERVPSTV